jgi:hypothetical protein
MVFLILHVSELLKVGSGMGYTKLSRWKKKRKIIEIGAAKNRGKGYPDENKKM